MNLLTNILNSCSFYIFSVIKLPGFSKQAAANRSSKAKDEEKEEEVTIKQNEGQKAVDESSKVEKVKVMKSLGEQGAEPISGGRRSTRNSAAAAMNKIKAGNIQLGTRAPTVSCTRLVVFSGGSVNKEIYETDDDSVHKSDIVSSTMSDSQSTASIDLQQNRCMVPQSSLQHLYRRPQTARRGRAKTPMSRLNRPREISKFKTDVTPKIEHTEEQRYVSNIIPDAEVETTDTAYEDWLAAQGLLGLKSSPAAEADAKILSWQTSVTNLHWSLDVIYKFIMVNKFSFVEKEEIELKLTQILHMLKQQVEPQTLLIRNIADDGDSKTDKQKKEIDESMMKEERKTDMEVQKVEENEDRSVDQKTEVKEAKSENAEEKEESNVICKNEDTETKIDESVKTEERKNEELKKTEKIDENVMIHKKEVHEKGKSVNKKSSSMNTEETKKDEALKKEDCKKLAKEGVEIGTLEEINKDEKKEESSKGEVGAKEAKKVSFAAVTPHEFVQHDSEDLPHLHVTCSDDKTPCVDESIHTDDTEEDDDDKIPLSQMKQVKAEDRMADYKGSTTDEFEDNSQDSDGDGVDENEYDEEDEDGGESISEEFEDDDDGDGNLQIDVKDDNESG